MRFCQECVERPEMGLAGDGRMASKMTGESLPKVTLRPSALARLLRASDEE
jgi:hypothetical protein